MLNKISRFLLFLCIGLGLVIFPQQNFASTGVGRVVHAYGQTWLERNGQLEELHKGQVILRSDTVVTGKRGRIKIMMSDGSKIYVGAKSRISIRKYTMKRNRLLTGTINLLWGKARFFVNKLVSKESSFQVRTPTAVLGVRGTEFIVLVPPTPELLNQARQGIHLEDLPPLPTRAALIEGVIQVSSGIGKPILLQPGHTADIDAGKTIRTFQTSSDDMNTNSMPSLQSNGTKHKTENKDKTEKNKHEQRHESQQDEVDNIAPPPPTPRPPAIKHNDVDRNKPMDNNETGTIKPPRPSLDHTTNAIQNLNGTTDIIIRPGFVKP